MEAIHTHISTAAVHRQPSPFPIEGKVRAKQAAPFLGIGISTMWLYVKQRRIKPPTKYGSRVSVWDATYIRQLAETGIPEGKAEEGEI